MNDPIFGRREDGGGSHLKGEQSRCFLRGEQTGGLFSLTESLMQPGTQQAPLHVHSREDETFYVIEGRITAIVGDQTRDLGPGESVWLPRGVPHRIHTTGEEPVRVLMLLTPAGLERFFDEIDAMNAEGKLSPGVLAATASRYGVTILGGAPSAE
jgi:mannose-6-phosphate isomerase-like protein (cupin superfamily)